MPSWHTENNHHYHKQSARDSCKHHKLSTKHLFRSIIPAHGRLGSFFTSRGDDRLQVV